MPTTGGPWAETTSAILMVVTYAVAQPPGSLTPAVQVEGPGRYAPSRPEATLIQVVVSGVPATRSPRGAVVAREDGREDREPARRIDVPRRAYQAFPVA